MQCFLLLWITPELSLSPTCLLWKWSFNLPAFIAVWNHFLITLCIIHVVYCWLWSKVVKFPKGMNNGHVASLTACRTVVYVPWIRLFDKQLCTFYAPFSALKKSESECGHWNKTIKLDKLHNVVNVYLPMGLSHFKVLQHFWLESKVSIQPSK